MKKNTCHYSEAYKLNIENTKLQLTTQMIIICQLNLHAIKKIKYYSVENIWNTLKIELY